jgi:hypothetical protein
MTKMKSIKQIKLIAEHIRITAPWPWQINILFLAWLIMQSRYGDNSTKIWDIFIQVMNYQTSFNTSGTITAIPILVYHNIDYKNSIVLILLLNGSSILPWMLICLIGEMKYLHDNGFKVLAISDLGYNQTSNKLYIKK